MNEQVLRYWKIAQRWWWLFIVSAIVPMVISYYFVSQQPDLYQAKATLMVGTSLQSLDPDPYQLSLSNTLANAYAELAKQGPVIEAVIRRLGLERTPGQLATQIGTRIYSGAHLLEIQVTDTNPEAAALIANALADELIRRSPASGGKDPEQQEFIRRQLNDLQGKIEDVGQQIDDLTASLDALTSATEIQDAQNRIAALEQVKSTYQSTYANLLNVYQADSPNVLSVFDPAVQPQWPIPSKAKLIVAVAGMAGIGLAIGAIVLMEYLDTSLRWLGDGVQSILDMPVLGMVPRVSREEVLLSNHNVLSPVAESIRAVRTKVFLMRPEHPFETLLLTSPSPGEGKSFVLANLAVVLASSGNRVIIIDADMRRPTLHELFDQPNVRGLADILSGNDIESGDHPSLHLLEVGFDNLLFMPAGRPPTDPATLLTSPRLPALLTSLKERADVILIDSPPVLGPPDATVLTNLVDGTIMVVSAGATKRESIQRARDQLLSQKNGNLLGVTVNRAGVNGSYYYYSPRPGGKISRGKTKENGEGVWLTLGEAAQRLGIGGDQARRWRQSGRLQAVRRGLRWWVDPSEIERVLEDMQKTEVEA